jgi:hypothetical protein
LGGGIRSGVRSGSHQVRHQMSFFYPAANGSGVRRKPPAIGFGVFGVVSVIVCCTGYVSAHTHGCSRYVKEKKNELGRIGKKKKNEISSSSGKICFSIGERDRRKGSTPCSYFHFRFFFFFFLLYRLSYTKTRDKSMGFMNPLTSYSLFETGGWWPRFRTTVPSLSLSSSPFFLFNSSFSFSFLRNNIWNI